MRIALLALALAAPAAAQRPDPMADFGAQWGRCAVAWGVAHARADARPSEIADAALEACPEDSPGRYAMMARTLQPSETIDTMRAVLRGRVLVAVIKARTPPK